VAEGAGVPRDRRADLEDLHRVVRPEHVMQHDHPRPGQGGDPDRLAGPLGQRLRPPQRPGAQLGSVQVGVAELQHARSQAVLARLGVLRDQVVRLQGAQQPVHRGLGQANSLGDLGHAEARCPRAEDAQDLGRALYRLDHVALSAIPNNIQDTR
jgi:hypothetical protein